MTDSVDEGKSGLLFKHGDIDEFASMAIKMLTDHRFSQKSRNGRLTWASKFSWDKTARATEEILKRILAEK